MPHQAADAEAGNAVATVQPTGAKLGVTRVGAHHPDFLYGSWLGDRRMWRDQLPLDPFRDAFLRSGMTISEFARRMGYLRTVPNIDQARRALGLRVDADREQPRRRVTYSQAVKMCDALELDYTDMDV